MKYYYPLCFITLILLNFGILDNLPFGDDYHVIFSESEVKNAPHPFLFFSPWSDYFKSWGLSYFLLWFIYKALGPENIVYYRIINLCLHFVCFLLLNRILEKNNIQNYQRRIASFIYLFNPLSVLTTSWIFQFKTLLAQLLILYFIYLLWFADIKSFKNKALIYTTFLLSLLSKVTGILLPFYALLYLTKNKLGLKRCMIVTLPLFLMSGFYGLINMKGITHLINEVSFIQKDLAENSIKQNIKRSETIDFKKASDTATKNQQLNFNPQIEIFDDIKRSIPRYLSNLDSPTIILQKYTVALQNWARLWLSSLGLNDFYPFYESNLDTFKGAQFYVYSLIGLGMLIFFLFKMSHLTLLTLLLFLPISGIFYVPYMKFSYTSDHWFYAPMLGIVMYLALHIKHKRIITGILCTCLVSYCYTLYKYQSFEHVLDLNANQYDNRVIMEHQALYSIKSGEFNEVKDQYLSYYNSQQNTNLRYLQTLREIGIKQNDKLLLSHIYPQFSKIILETEDYQALKIYLLQMHNHFTPRTLTLTDTMNAYFSNRIDGELYNRAIQYLE